MTKGRTLAEGKKGQRRNSSKTGQFKGKIRGGKKGNHGRGEKGTRRKAMNKRLVKSGRGKGGETGVTKKAD